MKTPSRLLIGAWIAMLLTRPVSAPAAGATMPSPALDPAQVETLITRLTDPDPIQREIAQADLEDLGQAVVPFLEAAKKSDDPELQRRAASAIAGIIAPQSPTRVTIDFTDAPVQTVLDELARVSGQRFTMNVHEPGRLLSTKISIHVKDEPFWSALLKICEPADLFPTGIYMPKEGFNIGEFGSWDHRFVSIHGPFAMSLSLVSRTSIVDYGKVGGQSSASIVFYVHAEEHCRPLACRNVVITRCEDGGGAPLKVKGGVESFNGHTFTPGGFGIQPARPRIALLEGTVEYVLEGRHLRVEVPEIVKADRVARRAGNVTLTVVECSKISDERWALRVVINRDRRSEADWNELKLRIRDTRPRLADRKEAEIPAEDYPAVREFPDACEFTYHMSLLDRRRQPIAFGEPFKLAWDIPTRRRVVTVPFHFEDIPLP